MNETLGSFWPSVAVDFRSKKAPPSSDRRSTVMPVVKALENETSTWVELIRTSLVSMGLKGDTLKVLFDMGITAGERGRLVSRALVC